MAVLKNVRCSWASLQEPNTTFDPVWEIVAHVDEATAAEFAALGVKVKEEETGKVLRFKRKVSGKRKKDGEIFNRKAPEVIDAAKQPFKDLIGNGSLVNIQYSLREWEMMGTSGVALDLERVQVLEVVEFKGKGSDEFEEEGVTTTIASEEEEDTPF